MAWTVKDLIDTLQQFNPHSQLDIHVSWYDGDESNHAHRDIWKHATDGIELDVSENDGIVCISNVDPQDACLY